MPNQYTTSIESAKVKKVCENCSKEFEIPRAWAKKSPFKFCSQKCKYARKKVECVCLQCKQPFVRALFAVEPRKGTFCSWECFAKSDKKPRRKPALTVNCEYCQKEFHPVPSEVAKGSGKYCSRECQGLAKRRPWQDRFWDFVDKTPGQGPKGDCWIWTGSKVGGKQHLHYGKFSYEPIVGEGQITAQAHRLSWELINGPIPEGLNALHSCDNPPCCNPDCLFLGTHQDNEDDKTKKGRRPKGEQCNGSVRTRKNGTPYTQFTANQIVNIRLRYATGNITLEELGKEFGVHKATIHNIIIYKSWKHI